MISDSSNPPPAEPRSPWAGLAILIGQILGVGALALLGAQLAFPVRIPGLPDLPLDAETLWNVFSTRPPNGFSLACCLLCLSWRYGSDLGWKGVVAWREAGIRLIRGRRRDVIMAVAGVSAFLLLLGLIEPLVVAYLVACAMSFAGLLTIFALVQRLDARRSSLVIGVTALLFGFLANAALSTQPVSRFTCKDPVGLRLASGEILPCQQLVALPEKRLWLVRGAGSSRLIHRGAVDAGALDRALGVSGSG